jgi:tRNA A-37 threonylcarbamoyl transferase component Bud32
MQAFEEVSGSSRYLVVAKAHRDGRTRTAVVALPGQTSQLHLRPLRHGGVFGGLRRGALLGLRRPLRELAATARLHGAGAPVPEPVLVTGWRLRGPFWAAVVGTLHVAQSLDGVSLLDSDPSQVRLLRAAAAAGRAVRSFHDAGGRHADLHVKNLVFREGDAATEAWVVDLDKARASRVPGPRRRAVELMRLYRSLLKRRLLERVGERGCARFLAAYVSGDRVLRRALRSHLRREKLRVALHALAYRR